ncbi:MAG: hypothetical protein OXH76_17210 [Boseongicola sp.]|nr:hypothetical protein [Boseongicola sp.]
MEAGDGVLAWTVLRQVDDYGDAWRRHGATVTKNALEPGHYRKPFAGSRDTTIGRHQGALT